MGGIRLLMLGNLAFKFLFVFLFVPPDCICAPTTGMQRMWYFMFFSVIYLTSLHFVWILWQKTKSARLYPAFAFYGMLFAYEVFLLISGSNPNETSHIILAKLSVCVITPIVFDWLGIDLNRKTIRLLWILLKKKARYLSNHNRGKND